MAPHNAASAPAPYSPRRLARRRLIVHLWSRLVRYTVADPNNWLAAAGIVTLIYLAR